MRRTLDLTSSVDIDFLAYSMDESKLHNSEPGWVRNRDISHLNILNILRALRYVSSMYHNKKGAHASQFSSRQAPAEVDSISDVWSGNFLLNIATRHLLTP